MRLRAKTLTLLSLLLSIFFLCNFISLSLGSFFFTMFLAVFTVHIGLLKVAVIEASVTLLECVFDNPVRLAASLIPSLEGTMFLVVFIYSGIIGISLFEIGFFRFAYRRHLPKKFKLGY